MPDGGVIRFDQAGDHHRLRRALGCFATGVAVVTTRAADGAPRGLTVNSFASVSLDPPLVLWSLGHHSRPTLDAFCEAGCFAVNVLADKQTALSRHFARQQEDKFAGIAYVPGHGGCPVLAEALAGFECRTETMLAQGDHTIFIGRVLQAWFGEGEPLIFSNGDYWGRRELSA